jgi:hypothetical protein
MLNNPNNNNVAGPMRQQTNGSRSVFARVMSTENIQVIFDPKSKDAWFDTKTRVLNMPSWTDMTPEVYDLLLSHEVSHALHTPTGGWISTVDELVGADASEADKGVARQYLNIIEDARIERLIKCKYPGLARDYTKGYKWLLDNKMFGDIKNTDISSLNFIDRINLHFKVGCHAEYTVPFSPEEQDIVDMVENARSFEDVQKVTRLVWDHAKGESENAPQPQSGGGGNSGGEGQDGKEGEGNTSGQRPNNNLNHMASKTVKAQEKFLDKNREKQNKYNPFSDKPIVMPEYNLSKVIVPHDLISKQMADAMGDCTTCSDWINESRSEYGVFISEAKPTVDAMVKAFMLKKAASAHHRQQQSKSGTLDMNLLSTYKWNEDLFKHFTIKPNGKNHGFIVHLDWSGSMGGLILNVVKQMYILTSFFRKIGVPYDVYAFSSHKPAGKYTSDFKEYVDQVNHGEENHDWKAEANSFVTNRDDALCPGGQPFYLYHFSGSTMNGATYKDMMEKVWMLAYSINPSSGNYTHRTPVFPHWLGLGDTPLDHALCASVPLVKAFQQKHRVEIMNVVAITDGSTSGSPLYGDYWSGRNDNTRLVNRRTGVSYDLTGQYTTNVLASYLKDETGCNTMMIYLSVNNSPNDRIPGYTMALPGGKVVADANVYWPNDPAKDALQKHWSDENYLIAVPAPVNGYDTPNVAEPCGFDAVFAIKMPRKATDDAYEDLDMTNTTYTRLKSQFVKSLSRKIVSRGLVNRMVEVVAKHT